MTITQLIQTSPAKANELFGKLEDTSDGALKTREKLFGDLKTELETLMGLEETHLFPVLRKHQETKSLVTDAVGDNKQVRKLLAELDKLSKTDPDFAPKLTELRKVFQSHVRDEKKELLPAVRTVLSREEAQAIVEKIETGRSEAEAARKAEKQSGGEAAANPRKRTNAAAEAAPASAIASQEASEAPKKVADASADATRKVADASMELSRKSAESTTKVTNQVTDAAGDVAAATKQVTETSAEVASDIVGRTVDAAAEMTDRMASTATAATNTAAENTRKAFQAVESGAETAKAMGNAATQSARQAVQLGASQLEQAASAVKDTARAAEQATQPLLRSVEASAQVPLASMDTLKDLSQVWGDLVKQSMETGARATQEMFRLNTPQQIVQVQSRVAVEMMSAWMNAGSRVMEISLRTSGAMRTASREVTKNVEKAVSASR